MDNDDTYVLIDSEKQDGSSPKSCRIPKIIHQTWETSDVPEHWKQSEQQWRLFCEKYGYEYKLWTASDRRELVAKKHPWFLPIFDAYKQNIQRVDTWRYFVLYDEGGFYCDLDIVPKIDSMHALIQFYNDCNVSVAIAKSATANDFKSQGEVLTNACVISQKHAPFWKMVWSELRKPLSEGSWTRRTLGFLPYFQVIFGTGPGILNQAYTKYCKTDTLMTMHPVVQIPCEFISCGFEWDPKPFQTPESVTILLAGSSWHTKSMKPFRYVSYAIHYREFIMIIIIVVLILLIILILLCMKR